MTDNRTQGWFIAAQPLPPSSSGSTHPPDARQWTTGTEHKEHIMGTTPIYDATAPIACTASRDEIPLRVELIHRMRLNLRRIERTDCGMRLHFPYRRDIVDDVQRFTIDEKRCCAFWGFETSTESDELVLRWDAPPALDDYVEKLIAFFDGDTSISEVSGLL
jgi:hypothetical protein